MKRASRSVKTNLIWHNSRKGWGTPGNRPVFLTGTNRSKICSVDDLRLNWDEIWMSKLFKHRLKEVFLKPENKNNTGRLNKTGGNLIHMQHSTRVQHYTELYCKPLKHGELSLNRPPIGQYTAQYMVVSAVNLLLFFLSPPPPPPFPCSIVSGLTAAQTGLWVGSSTVKYPSVHPLTPKSNVLCLESAAGSLESRPASPTSHTMDSRQTQPCWTRGRMTVEKMDKRQRYLGGYGDGNDGVTEDMNKTCLDHVMMLWSSLFSTWISH